MALSGDNLDELVKPNMLDEWARVKSKWFPRTDTPENIAYDKRTPGIPFLTLILYFLVQIYK